MPRSKAKTVAEYLAQLPEDRRAAIAAVRQHVLRHLPKGYEETMSAGMASGARKPVIQRFCRSPSTSSTSTG